MPARILGALSLAIAFLAFSIILGLQGCASSPSILTALEPGKNEECEEHKLPVRFQVCVYHERNKSRDVLYYFHGTGDWVHSFSHPTASDGSFVKRQIWLAEMRKAGGVPTIVTVSFGRSYLLNEERMRIVSEIIRRVEVEYGPFQHRLVWGFSMGGHNALRLLLTYPALFYKAVIAAPNLPLCDPFVGKDALYLCYFHNPGTKGKVNPSLGLAASFQIKDSYSKSEYDRVAPLILLKGLRQELPPLYITVGDHDQFGFFEGTLSLVAELKRQHRTFTLRQINGGDHNSFEPREIANFLSAR